MDHLPTTKFSVKRSLPSWVWLLAPFVLLSPVWLSGQALFFGTPYLQFVPWRSWAWDMLAQGQLPLWNPLVGMGAPLAANYQAALFYPPNAFLWLLHGIGGVELHAWGQALLVAAHLAWAGLGMSRLARRIGVAETGQVVAGLAFGLSSYLVSRAGFLSINSAAAWTPWVILGAEQITQAAAGGTDVRRGAAPQAALLFSLSLALQLLAGHAQTTWYTLVLAGVWLIAGSLRRGGWRGLLRTAAWAAGGGAMAGLLAAVQLIPTMEYLGQSQRATAVNYEYAVNYSFWPYRFLSLIAPDLFGNPAQGDYWFNVFFWEDAVYLGLLPLLLAAGAILGRRNRDAASEKINSLPISPPGRRFWIGLLSSICGAAFLMALGRYTPIFPFLYQHIPTFAMFQAPTRWSLLAVFALALLAGMGADGWHRPEKRALYWTRLGTAGAVAVMLGAGAGWLTLGDVRPTFIRATALAGFWAVGAGVLTLLAPRRGSITPTGWRMAVTGWVMLDLLVAGWGLNPGISTQLYTRTEDQSASWVETGQLAGRLYIPQEVEEANKFERFFRVEAFRPEEDPLNLSDALLPNSAMLAGIPMINNFDPLVPGRYARWMDYLASLSPTDQARWLPRMGVSMIQIESPSIPRQTSFAPVDNAQRFRWAACALAARDEEAAFVQLTNSTTPINNAVILEGIENNLADCSTAENHLAVFSVADDQPDRVVVAVDAPAPGWLVQADTWYPGWTVRVDGQQQALLRADYLFRAVALPAGIHTVEFLYRPLSFLLGATLTILGLAASAAAWWFLCRK